MTNPAAPHVVFAHGFTQTGRGWEPVEAALKERIPGATTLAVDLPGHGDASDLRCDLWQAADLLATSGGPGCYVGYSMGGRIALHSALSHPQRVGRLVLIGATAGIDDDDERRERRVADQELADSITRRSVPAFVDDWLANPLFTGLTDETSMREDRLRNSARGLASSLRLAGTGTQEPLWSRLGEISCPVLVIVGERDEKFRALGERLVASLPDASLTVVADAGHAVHLERPGTTVDALVDFVA